MPKIFLSHAHADKELAHELAEQIRIELDLIREDVFDTSEPGTIEGEWRGPLLAALESAEILIPLITPASEKSVWVAFEIGNFMARRTNQFIHPLVHPKSDVNSSLLNWLQHDLVTDRGVLENFFRKLCRHFDRDFSNKANLKAIIEKALRTPAITAEGRQLQLTCKLHLITAKDLEVKKAILNWMQERDILHDAQFAWIGDLQEVAFTSASMQRIDLGGNDLRRASFWGANLEDAKLGSTKLQGADFTHATLRGASFQGAELDHTTILPDGRPYTPNLGLEQLKNHAAVIDR